MSIKRQLNVLRAPWPPGVDWRSVTEGCKFTLFQLRPGAFSPLSVALLFEVQTVNRAFRYGVPPCEN